MARKKRKLATPPPVRASKSWAICGVDTSMSSLAGGCFGYDAVLDSRFGPATSIVRWQKGDHYLDRMAVAARSHIFILDLLSGASSGSGSIPLDRVFIAIEEPWPMGLVKKMESGWLKQQAQMQGAFLGGLVRYGYANIFEVNNMAWKKPIADEMGVTLAGPQFKWVVKEWAMDAYGLPDMPDLIESKHGKIPRPEGSTAKAKQPEDIYDALGIAAWMENELLTGGTIDAG